MVMVVLRAIRALCCYACLHAIFFWCFYELSILALLYLLVTESPYSERYVASWYLMGYIVFTRLPMILALLYFGSVFGRFKVSLWRFEGSGYDTWLLGGLGLLFITKIPLFPFHT